LSPDRVARLLRAGGWAALASFGFVLALLLQPLPLDLSLRVYAVALGGIALALVLSMGSLRPLFGATAMRRPRGGTGAPARPAGLAELEHAVDFGLSSGFDLHHRLRPALRQIAAERLARAGVDMDSQPRQAQALLGDEAWELLRPERPQPARRSRGVTAASLDRIVAAVERTG